MQNVIKILSYIPRIRTYIILLTSLNLLAAGIGAIQPYAFKLIIDSISNNSHSLLWAVMPALGLLLTVRMINATLNYVNQIQSHHIFYRIINGLRSAIFQQISNLSIDYFEREKLGAISQRYNTNTNDVARWAHSSVSTLVPQTMVVIVTLIVLSITNLLVGIIATISIALFFATQIPILKKLKPLLKKSQKESEKASSYFSETISHITTVRSFGGEQSALKKQNEALNKFKDLRMHRERRLGVNIVMRQTIYALMMVISMGLIADGVAKGRNTIGDILLVALYLQNIQGALWPIGAMIIRTTEADASAERIIEMLETQPTVIDTSTATELGSLQTVEFKNVSFAYPGKRRKVLQGVSFRVEPGQTLALVGPSGAGKTTITKLLLRFYEPSAGQVLINDQPIETFTQASIRRHMGVVMQDVALFNDTIKANLQLANPKAKPAAVRAAAAQAHADIFIDKLPDKYKSLVGERGIKLSGGEKQRVAVARAILKEPQLIILDEATSALDSESEQYVQAGLRQLMSGRTAIVIAHRLSTIMRADTIIVMDGGKIVEQGTHDTLKKKRGGLYARLHKLQTEGYIKA